MGGESSDVPPKSAVCDAVMFKSSSGVGPAGRWKETLGERPTPDKPRAGEKRRWNTVGRESDREEVVLEASVSLGRVTMKVSTIHSQNGPR